MTLNNAYNLNTLKELTKEVKFNKLKKYFFTKKHFN